MPYSRLQGHQWLTFVLKRHSPCVTLLLTHAFLFSKLLPPVLPQSLQDPYGLPLRAEGGLSHF